MLLSLREREGFHGVRHLAGASGILLAGRVAGAGANLAFAVLLARSVSVPEVGAVFAAISTAFLTSIILTMNIESGSIRFLVAARHAGDEETVNGFIAFGRRLLFCLTAPVGAAYAAIASLNPGPLSLSAILFAAISIPAIAWMRLAGSHATALGKPARGSLPRTALQPLLLIIIFLAALALGAPASGELALLSFLASFAATAIVQFLLLHRYLKPLPTTGRRLDEWRNWIANGFYMAPNILLQDYLQHSILIAAAFALGAEDIAILGLSLRCISLIRFGVLSINIAASPMIARAIAEENHGHRDSCFRNAALLKAPPAFLALAGAVLFGGPILSLFGAQYAREASILAWLALIPLASALLGPNYMLLNISGARRELFATSLAALAVLFAATPALGAVAGPVGAATAAASVFAAWEFALYLIARLKLGMDASILSVFSTRQGNNRTR